MTMRVDVGSIFGQVVVKTTGLSWWCLEAMQDMLGFPRGESQFLVGERGVGYELFMALRIAAECGAKIFFKKDTEETPIQILMARDILYYQLQGQNGYCGVQALIIRSNKPCVAHYGDKTFLVGPTFWVEERLVGASVVARANLNEFTYAIVEE